jgi:hypothetical protein
MVGGVGGDTGNREKLEQPVEGCATLGAQPVKHWREIEARNFR